MIELINILSNQRRMKNLVFLRFCQNFDVGNRNLNQSLIIIVIFLDKNLFLI